jgi:mRNA-degrading endonuclease toxin of MazEF toxin-antitoxin module
MQKDFWRWHAMKEMINNGEGSTFFHEREVWWCALAANIGFEQDGSSDQFTRPVVILSKFNLDAGLVVPLTAKPKTGKYYFSVGDISGRDAVAILSQIRFVDRKRLAVKIATMDEDSFNSLTKAIVRAYFPNFDS